MSNTANQLQESSSDNGNIAELRIPGRDQINLPIRRGTDGSLAIDIQSLQPKHGVVTIDESYSSTASTESRITFIDPVGDGKEAKLQYRGYPIRDLAGKSDVLETAYLLIHGELPTKPELDEFSTTIRHNTIGHNYIRRVIENMPANSHPMCLLGTAVNSLQAQYAFDIVANPATSDRHLMRIFAQLPILAAWVHNHRNSMALPDPNPKASYVENYLGMMFGKDDIEHRVDPFHVEIMSKILILHADHEQNASTTVVRNIRSTNSNLYAAVSGGIGALWGPLHGGANEKVIGMLEGIHTEGISPEEFINRAKTSKEASDRLMGFGHRVYKAYDPRAQVMKDLCERFFSTLKVEDPLLRIAEELEKRALADDYFVQRKLYPNVDFYSGVLLHGMGIPSEEFTVIFALGRVAGWLAQAREFYRDPNARIARPRQLYTGELDRTYTPIEERHA